MDDLDRRLIGLLRQDARAPVASLARALKVSRSTVQSRIDRMLQKGEISGFTIRVSGAGDGGRVRAVTMVAVEGERSQAVVKALSRLPEVEAIHSTNGRWDLVVELNTDSLQAFSRSLDEIRRIDGIASSETSLLLETLRV
jgi:DNA-binding Lrp family transcriptional regulator